MMPGFQPAVIGAAEFCKWSEFDHGIFPWFDFSGGAGRPTRPASLTVWIRSCGWYINRNN
jgi:hypothetical protein